MEKKTKIILISILGVAVICIVLAIILSNSKKYIVTFDTNGGSLISNQEVKKGSYVSKPVDPIKIGYNFLYWSYNGSQFDFTTKIDKDTTLIAEWELDKQTYQVTLEVDGKKQTVEVKEGDILDLEKLTFEEKEGFEIKWKLNDKEFDIEKEKITDNISLIGEYVKVNVYTITFNSDGGSKVENQKVNENRTVKEPTEPTKEGYVFDAWYLDNVKYDFKEKVTKNITLKAKWIEDKNLKRYTVTFNSDGGSKVANQTIIENKKVTKPTNPTKNGYTFVEWQLNGKAYDFNSKVDKDITLKAVWNQVKNYTIKFILEGGNCTNCSSQTVEYGKKATKPNDPTRTNFAFTGWVLKNGNSFDFNMPITSDITLYAKWKQTVTHTVKFDLDGGSCTNCSTKTVVDGEKVTRPNDPTKTNYVFTGWNFDFNKPITSDVTIKATWKQTVNHTVNFDLDGGSCTNCSSQTVADGGKVTKPNDPTKTNYVFTGWNFDFNTSVTSDITIKANWRRINEYTVSFNTNGGTTYNPQTVREGGKATNPGTPTRNGYTFNGWDFDFNTVITSNITINAKWTEIVYTIKSSRVDDYSTDLTLSVWNGNTQITNYRCISTSTSTDNCIEGNSVPKSFYDRTNSFVVIFNDGSTIRATK